MADVPILFSGPMVRSIIELRKRQTRRILKPIKGVKLSDLLPGQPHSSGFGELMVFPRDKVQEPKIKSGDRLWVRETACDLSKYMDAPLFRDRASPFAYRADGDNIGCHHWRPSIFMPRHISRITLIVEDVKVERLQDISQADAVAEGLEWVAPTYGIKGIANSWDGDPRKSYAALWDTINGPDAWNANPWVGAYTFHPIFRNIDEVK